MANTVSRTLSGLGEFIAKESRLIMQQIGDELTAYYVDNLGADIGSEAFAAGGTVRRRKFPRNERKGAGTLRIVSADLSRALEVGQDGNLTNIVANDDGIILESGIDLDIIPYARVHELGGMAGRGLKARMPARPYLAPGMQAYIDERLPDKLDKLSQKIARWYNGR
jgi:phage gpG-like protein